MEKKSLRELIGTIHIDESNLTHITKTKVINGTLLIEFERVANTYAKQQNGYLNEEIDDLQEEVDGCDHDLRLLQKKNETLSTQHAKMVDMLTYIMDETNFQSHFPTTSIKVKNLLSSIKKGGSDE